MGRPLEKLDSDSRCGEGISDELYRHCTTYESVTLLLAGDPSLTPGQAWKRLYGQNRLSGHRHHERRELESNGEASSPKGRPGLEKVAACGKWGKEEPSPLFLKMYWDALRSVDNDIEQAVVSPSLMGSCGTVPLTIISTIPDIARHMSNLIVRAEKEVILATNYWQNSIASTFITNAIRELSARVGARAGPDSPEKVVIKVIYDRGSTKQVFKPHYEVLEREFTDPQVNLPPLSEIPNVDLQVLNFHQPMLGTFHAKFMVVDRRMALIQSNNVQDNANMEMAVQVEGPIVDAVYDMALITWNRELGTALPMIDSPAAGVAGKDAFPSWTESYEKLIGEDGRLRGYEAVVDPARMKWTQAYGNHEDSAALSGANGVDGDDGKTETEALADTMNGTSLSPSSSAPSTATPESHFAAQPDDLTRPSSAATSSSPSPSTSSLPEHTHESPHYDEDIAGEIYRMQASLAPLPHESPLDPITRRLNHTKNPSYSVPNQHLPKPSPPSEQMTPYMPHPVHEPVPMAMVNRPPYGPPNHSSVSNPQNEAWLSALRNAERSVFIQSPTLNAEPLLPAIVDACERGVDVWCYICIGYNDAGELLPMQGGHNEAIPPQLLSQLTPEARPRLHYFWYVAKDHGVPLVQFSGKRACHIKLLIADERVGIVGSGNQDTQSWFQSQETNIMLDSPEICRSWIDALRRNQNTGQYGKLGEDGIFRDAEGKEVEGSTGVDPGRFSWAKGLVGAVRRVQGKGGFG